jgi:DNA-binding phage protein
MRKAMNARELPAFDPARYLDNEESVAVYLTGILQANDAALGVRLVAQPLPTRKAAA